MEQTTKNQERIDTCPFLTVSKLIEKLEEMRRKYGDDIPIKYDMDWCHSVAFDVEYQAITWERMTDTKSDVPYILIV